MTTVPIEPIDSVTITTLVDNVSDMLLQNEGPAKRVGLAGGGEHAPRVPAAFLEGGETADVPLAEHGFSALITVTKDRRERHVLFDTGLTPDGAAENMRRLGLSSNEIEAIVLSHGHFDHTVGLDGVARALGRRKVPLIVHPDAWTRRRVAIPGREPSELPLTNKAALEEAVFEIIENREPSLLLDGSLLVTGEVERTTKFEQGFPIHQAYRDGDWQPDPLIPDDQAAVFNVRDKGLVVLTGCGHAGIVNIVRYARKLTGVERVYAVIGGFHLSGPFFEPIIPATCEALVGLAPEVIVPAHCTGWRATHALAATFPDAFIQNSVGTRYEL
jgi:7,8-dihydropterin-6-yl-methyl-4-(beta-D-ribofuranosyl)aminobenzene 5'-phosphate synthase